jgi:hypothetical protein
VLCLNGRLLVNIYSHGMDADSESGEDHTVAVMVWGNPIVSLCLRTSDFPATEASSTKQAADEHRARRTAASVAPLMIRLVCGSMVHIEPFSRSYE